MYIQAFHSDRDLTTLRHSGITPAPVQKYTAPSGIASNTPAYTIPSIRLDGKHIMDSTAIARALEAAHPAPSLHLDHPMQTRVKEVLIKAFIPIRGDVIPQIPEHVLSPGSIEYWVRTRTADLGDLATYRKEHGGEQAYQKAHAPLEEAAALLKENGGPFFLGEQASYADFLWTSFVLFVKRATEEGFQRMMSVDEALKKHFEACMPWTEKDD
jgi:glutathione S-transferase